MGVTVQIGKMKMKNPVTVASGTFGSGEEMSQFLDLSLLGAITTKGTSLVPWIGNPPPRTVETPAGMLNAIGLQNDGVEDLINRKMPFLRQFDLPVIVNIVGHSVDEYVQMARRLDGVPGVSALEINISCPNVRKGRMFGSSPETASEVVSNVRAETDLTLITKLSPNVTDIVSIARAVVEAGSDALSLINTLIGAVIDIETRKYVLANQSGGLSGPCIRPVAVWKVHQVAQANLGVPIIGMGGIMEASDAIQFFLAGATAVAVGTGTFVNPMAAALIIEGIEAYLASHGFADISELVGAVK